jgi:hypothetical protein
MMRPFTIRRLFPLLLFVTLFTLAAREVMDPDFWWHLRIGEYIAVHHAVPAADLYSSTRAGQPWVAHEWGAELLIYATYSAFGWAGLICGFSAIVAAAFGFVYLRSPGKPYIAGIAVALGALASAITWGVRTQMFTLLLASVFLYLLSGYMEHGGRRVWLLVPLMLVWANLHAGFFVGLALMAVYAAGIAADAFAGFADWPAARSRIATLAFVLAASFLVVMVNPRGPKLLAFFGVGILSLPFSSVNASVLQTYIPEWQVPDFHNSALQPFLWLVLATFAVMIVSRKRVRPSALVVLLPAAYAALHSVRHIPIFALIASPLLAEHLEAWLASTAWAGILRRSDLADAPAGKAALNVLILLSVILAGSVHVAGIVRNQPQWERQEFPAAAVEFLKANRLPGPLYHPYEWGGYLIWRAYPQYRVFIDGRTEIYGEQYVESYFRAQRGRDDAHLLLDRYGINTALGAADGSTALLLANDPQWKKVFEDQQAVIFTRRTALMAPEESVVPDGGR